MDAVEQVTHRNFHLIGKIDRDSAMDWVCSVFANTDEQPNPHTFREKLGYTHEFVLHNLNTNDPSDQLLARTIARAKARIDLGLNEDNGKYEEKIFTTTPLPEQKSDPSVQQYILGALERIRKNSPQSYNLEAIEVDGICDLLGIHRNQYLFNAGILREEGYIGEGDVDQLDIGNGGIWITNKGLQHLDLIRKMASADFVTKGEEEFTRTNEFDLVVSYASEDSVLAKEIAESVKKMGFQVFCDQLREVKSQIWGKNQYDFFADIYSKHGRYCLMIISQHYANKPWTNHERQNAQARALKESGEYILPVRVDDAEIQGMPDTVNYIDSRNTSTSEIVEMIVQKLSS
jgi:hypothetical protein